MSDLRHQVRMQAVALLVRHLAVLDLIGRMGSPPAFSRVTEMVERSGGELRGIVEAIDGQAPTGLELAEAALGLTVADISFRRTERVVRRIVALRNLTAVSESPD